MKRVVLAGLDESLIVEAVEMVVACLLVALLAIAVMARMRMAMLWSLGIGMWIVVGVAMLGAALLTLQADETAVDRRLKPWLFRLGVGCMSRLEQGLKVLTLQVGTE